MKAARTQDHRDEHKIHHSPHPIHHSHGESGRGKTRKTKDSENPNPSDAYEPPRAASIALSAILDPDRAEAVLGDLEERFHTKVRQLGIKKARQWYWYET